MNGAARSVPRRFHTSCPGKLIEAQEWYEREAPGLGRRFRLEADRIVGRVSESPRQFPLVYKTVRRALFRKFPYALYFVMQDDALTVIACFHGSRNPAHWQRRT